MSKRKAMVPQSRIEALREELRDVIAKYADIPEKQLFGALCAEAEGWQMRLEEIEDEEADGD